MSDIMLDLIGDPEVRKLITSALALKNPGVKSVSMKLDFSFRQSQIPKLKQLLPDWVQVNVEDDEEFHCYGESDGWKVWLVLFGPPEMPCWEADLRIRKQ